MMMQDVVMTLLVNTAVFSLLFALMLPVRALLAKRISAVLQYALWAVVVVKLIIPFGLESTLSPLALFKHPDTAVIAQTDDGMVATVPDGMNAQSMAGMAQTETSSGLQSQTGNAQAQTQQGESGAYDGQTGATAQPMGWAAWALIAWAIGTLVVGAAQCACTVNLRRCARHAKLSVPDRVTKIYEGCKRELGIERRIGLIVQSTLRVPVITGAVKPILVLPEDVTTQTDAQIRHICIHELMHFRRGDLVVIALMGALRAVYWFNPLVWLCFQLIRKDMETACDSRVLRHIGTGERTAYIGTVLQFAGCDGKRWLQAAMGMADGRVTMELRIHGMYRRMRTGGKTKALALCMAVLMLAMSVLTACQPTPEEPVVVGKGDDHLEEMIVSSAQSPAVGSPDDISEAEKIAALRDLVGAPETFSDSYTSEKGDVTVTIDAQVLLPPAEGVPALTVTLSAFSQEQTDQFINFFLHGEPVFSEEQVQTKDEIMAMIIWRRQEIELAKQYVVENLDEVVADLEARIAELLAEYEAAPEERERTPADTQLLCNEYGTYLSVAADLDKGAAAQISVNNSGEYGSSFRFTNDGVAGFSDGGYDVHSPGSEAFEGIPRGMTMTIEDAQATVEQCLADLEISDMQIESVGASAYYKDISDRNDADYALTAPQCYVFTLVREIQGIPVPLIGPSVQLSTDDPNVSYPEQPDFNYIAEPECLLIYVDDTGIVQFIWSNPVEVTSVMSAQVTLMPFEDIVQNAKDNMFYKVYTAYDDQVEIEITSVRLSMMRIMRKDSPGESLLVPVWDFIGTQRNITDGQPGEWSSFGDRSYVTINAIDGSSINREWGY